jgi:hexokinase
LEAARGWRGRRPRFIIPAIMVKTTWDGELTPLRRLFAVSGGRMRMIIDAFHREMRLGLAGEPGSLRMLPTYVDLPSGRERGTFLALDLGGTNVRVLWAELPGDGCPPRLEVEKFRLSREQVTADGEVLFGAVARFIGRFLAARGRAGEYRLGFTFSFAIRQHSIARGDLIAWTKGWTAEGVVGRDVVALLNRALAREGLAGVRVVSLNNDTTGTLMALAYLDPDCDAGCILGTGTNICYRERTTEIRKPIGPYSRDFMIVNMESGNFNAALPRNKYDDLLDRQSGNPGRQAEEKMVAGKYLGELVRLVVVDFCKRGRMFDGRLPDIFAAREGFGTERLSEIEEDESPEADRVRFLLGEWGERTAGVGDAAKLREISRIVSTRAARLAAAVLAATVTKNDPALDGMHAIAVDGSVFEKHPGFEGGIWETFRELFGDRAERIRLKLTHDGSGLGAAIIAAVSAAETPGGSEILG